MYKTKDDNNNKYNTFQLSSNHTIATEFVHTYTYTCETHHFNVNVLYTFTKRAIYKMLYW